MRDTHHHRLLAAVTLLVTGCFVQGKQHNTVTVISAITQTVTQQPLVTTIANASTAPPLVTIPPPPPAPPAASVTPASGSQGEVLLTIALEQAALVNFANALGGNKPPGVITIQAGNTAAPAPATVSPGNLPTPTAASGPSITGLPNVPLLGSPQMSSPPDPAQGGFPGGNPPSTTVDLPLTIFFLLLFIVGAITHISIYRANAKRGHKFLLSDLMFDFCMVRTVTCIFRIIWVFVQARGVVLAAQIFFNGGASVIFAVNIFLVQRIVRSMHPEIGWSRPFSIITRIMAISVPIIIILQIISIILLFFSVDDATRFDTFDTFLKFGTSYLLILATFPLWSIFLACSIPGPKPEKFGVGSLRVKTSLVMLASVMLTTGAIVRTYAFFNPRPSNTDDVLYGKSVFYTTQFTLEIFVVAAYALLRFDLLFHIPNGSSRPGDYSTNVTGDTEKGQIFTRENIETRIAACGVPHQILSASYLKSTVGSKADQPIYAVFFPQTSNTADLEEVEEEAKLPPRPPRRVSRRETLTEYIQGRPMSMRVRPLFDGSPSGRGVRGPPFQRSSTLESWSIAPQFKFTRPRQPPEPPK